MEPQEILELMPDPVTEWRYRRQLCREAYDRGYSAGFAAGYERAAADLENLWQLTAQRVKKRAESPTLTEINRRRWTILRGGAA